jgi:hypothetical protein
MKSVICLDLFETRHAQGCVPAVPYPEGTALAKDVLHILVPPPLEGSRKDY